MLRSRFNVDSHIICQHWAMCTYIFLVLLFMWL